MSRIHLLIILAIAALVAFVACTGDTGPAGPAGATGPAGPSQIVGFAHINAFDDARSPTGACVYWVPTPLGRPCIFNGGGEATDSVRVVKNDIGEYKIQFFGSYGQFVSGTGRLEMTILATITSGEGQYVATVEQQVGPGEGLGREDQINVLVWLWNAETGALADRNFSVVVLR